MNYLLQFGEEDDFQDDYESGGGRKKLFSKIRKRMSMVKSNRQDDDEEEYDESTRNDDDEQYGFLKRKLKKRQEQKEMRKQQQQQQQEMEKKEKPKRGKSNEKQGKETRRSSIHRVMPRLSASRTLRMSISRAAPSGLEVEEEDVAMPLPGHAHEDTPDLDKLLAPPGDEKEGKKGRFLKRLTKISSTNNGGLASSAGKEKKKSSGGSVGSRKNRLRKKSKSQSSDRSVDSPPSVASTESSIDNMGGKGGAAQHHAPRRGQSTKRRSGLGPFGKLKNGDDDEAGVDDCASLNTQSIPWIIKTWIYFVTVVVPFTILYYCFTGISHSSTLDRNPILQKVCIANMLFNGLGCTYRTGFWARQALDARGIRAVTKRGTESVQITPPPDTQIAPKKLLKRNRYGKANEGRLGGFMGSIAMPQSASIRMPRSRRSVGPSANPLGNFSTRLLSGSSDHLRPPTRNIGGARLAPAGIGGARSSLLSNMRIDSSGGIGNSIGRSEQNRSHGAMTGSGSQTLTSVWDVENLIPFKKKTAAPATRPSIDKHRSIMEIYEVHATDEKVALLQ